MVDNIQRVKNFFSREQIYRQLQIMLSYLVPDKKDIELSLNIGGGSYTDGKKIVVGLPEIFLDKTEAEIFVALKALIGHEAQHINSSSFKVMQDFATKVTGYFYNEYKIPAYKSLAVAKHVFNSVEDGRIEKILVNRYRGYLKYLKFLNGETWKNYPLKGNSELEDFLYTITTVSVTGLKPKNFNELYKGSRLEEEINKIIPLIIKGINAKTCQKCSEVCYDIILTCKDYIKDLIEEEDKNTENFLQSRAQEKEFETDEEKDYNDNPSVSTHFKDEEKNKEGKGENKNEENENRKNEETENNNHEEKSNKGSEKETGEEEKENRETNGEKATKKEEKTNSDREENKQDGEKDDKISSKNRANMKKNKKSNNEENQKPKGKDFENNNSEEADDQSLVERTMEEIQDVIKEANDTIEREQIQQNQYNKKEIETNLTDEEIRDLENQYKDDNYNKFKEVKINMEEIIQLPSSLKNKGRILRKEIEKLFLNKKTFDRRSKKGILNTNDLWKLAIKENDIFIKKGRNSLSNYCVFILQDGSGSMSDANKEVYSMEALAVLEEALKGIIPFKISTFATEYYSDYVVHYTAKEFDDNKPINYSYNFFKYRRASGGNKDGYSIRVATKELLKRSEKDKILIVLSDGLPSSYKGGYIKGREDVREAVKEARKKGIIVISIMFGSKSDREEMMEDFKYMYGDNLISCEPNEIQYNLSKLMKKLLKR